MSDRQKRLVRESFQSLEQYAESVLMLFYGRWFATDPSVRPLFQVPIKDQSRKLMETLRTVADAQDDFEGLRPLLAELGRKHLTYGAQPRHYETMRSALLWALGQTLGEEFSRDTKEAWTALLIAVSAVMIEAADTHGASRKEP
jgi:hemoglobin-like flavoprotein